MTTLYVAADNLSGDEEKTLDILQILCGTGLHFGIKINLDYILRHGYERAFRLIKYYKRPIFVDLKMCNGTRTMVDIAKALVWYEVDFFNVYALADSLLPKVIEATRSSKTKVLGVTVLSHFDDDYCWKHFKRSFVDLVHHLTQTTIDVGCDGSILPGTALDAVAALDIPKWATGVRDSAYADDRHKQKIEPAVAKEKKAEVIICGSPIMYAADPVGALRRIHTAIQ